MMAVFCGVVGRSNNIACQRPQISGVGQLILHKVCTLGGGKAANNRILKILGAKADEAEIAG